MNALCTARGGGRSTAVLEAMVGDPNLLALVPTYAHRRHLALMARDKGYEERAAHTIARRIHVFDGDRFETLRGIAPTRIVIDDVDAILSLMIPGLHQITFVTMPGRCGSTLDDVQ